LEKRSLNSALYLVGSLGHLAISPKISSEKKQT
jgi:hypothetical protein